MVKNYRKNGTIGALLDEYEKAVSELKEVIKNLNSQQLTVIVDKETKDPSCKSIQTILSHVLLSGYWFVVEIRKHIGEEIDYPQKIICGTAAEYQKELDKMFRYNEQFFEDYPAITIEEKDSEKKIKVLWGQTYDVEQMFEHAIVHVLKHRRQIERFLLEMKK